MNKRRYGIRSRWYLNIWWLDVLYPLVLSGVLFSGLTYFIYHGEKHRSISGKAESQLLYFSVRAASPRIVRVPDRVLTVSLQESDLRSVDSYEYHGFRDVTMPEYARLIQKILDSGGRYIVVNWMHSQKRIPDYQPLVHVLKNAPEGSKIIFAVPPKLQDFVPEDLFRYSVILESDPCAMDVQVMCVYQSHWEGWVIQEIVRDSWQSRTVMRERQVISKNLPRIFSGYILYLNKESDFKDYSYSEILAAENISDKTFRHKMIFIGNSLIQDRLGDYVQLGRVGTSMTERDSDPRVAGTPFHQFWAQIAQLFIDDALVTVVPEWLSFSLALIFAIIITLCLACSGVPVALGVYLSIAVLAPLVNALLIHFFYLYIPVFDTIYAGLSTFILVTFFRLSVESFRQWRLDCQSQEDEEIADIKSNFISLVSHNLNTPVAKMQGMLDILGQLPLLPELSADIQRAGSLVAGIQLCIRHVLVMTAIEDRRMNHEPMSIMGIRKEFQSYMNPPLRKFGIHVRMKELRSDSMDELIPLHFDRRVLMAVIGSMVLFSVKSERTQSAEVELSFEIKDQVPAFSENGRSRMALWISCEGQWVDPHILAFLSSVQDGDLLQMNPDSGLLEDISSRFLKQALEIYRGKISCQHLSDQRVLLSSELYPVSA
ncbi:MAG: HAMP domain-containing histidine kinase [Deltaproteobacteria bacterium]|nr:HAMP domain-containing histidine kinase [Deltaproteobacteria bacterium]